MTNIIEIKPKFESQKKWRDRNPKAVWAQSAMHGALRRGLIQRRPCEICGEQRVDGHHSNYDRPMDVTWLCRKHHKAAHAMGLARIMCEAVLEGQAVG